LVGYYSVKIHLRLPCHTNTEVEGSDSRYSRYVNQLN